MPHKACCMTPPGSHLHVGQQYAFELQDGFVVHHNGSCMRWVLLPVHCIVCCTLRLLLLLLLELVHVAVVPDSHMPTNKSRSR